MKLTEENGGILWLINSLGLLLCISMAIIGLPSQIFRASKVGFVFFTVLWIILFMWQAVLNLLIPNSLIPKSFRFEVKDEKAIWLFLGAGIIIFGVLISDVFNPHLEEIINDGYAVSAVCAYYLSWRIFRSKS